MSYFLKVQNQYLGAFYMCISVLAWAIVDGIIKKLTFKYSLIEIIFFREGINALILIFLGLGEKKGLAIFKTAQPKIHCWRALISVLNTLGFTYAISKISLSDAYTLGFSAPLFMIIFSKITISEPLNMQRCLCLLIGFIGIIVVLRPDKQIFEMAGFIALMTGLLYALSTVLINKIHPQDHTFLVALYPNLACFLLASTYVSQEWIQPVLTDSLLFILAGSFAALAQCTIIKAVRLAPMSLIAPLEYSSLIWVILIDYFLFEFKIDFWLYVGISLIVGSNLYLIVHEGKTVLKKTAQ